VDLLHATSVKFSHFSTDVNEQEMSKLIKLQANFGFMAFDQSGMFWWVTVR
jgi:hypothetical protein